MRGSKLDEELHALRRHWTSRSISDAAAEIERLTNALRAAEGEIAKEQAGRERSQREFRRLQEIEKLYRREVAERKYTNVVADVNTDLRRCVVRGEPAEDVIRQLHDELTERDSNAKALESEIRTLRAIQKDVVGAHSDAGHLLAAKQHNAFLTRHMRQMGSLNQVLQEEMVRLLTHVHTQSPRYGSASPATPQTPASVPRDDLLRSWHSLQQELAEARRVIDSLVVDNATSPSARAKSSLPSHPEPVSSRRYSPPKRSNPPSSLVPFGFRLRQ
ncbi:hypothetical protein DIPPA_08429 [Diplonema papillatum]|nr:hypothetical protein DIPPA_08429 [Diplonema papillatum]